LIACVHKTIIRLNAKLIFHITSANLPDLNEFAIYYGRGTVQLLYISFHYTFSIIL